MWRAAAQIEGAAAEPTFAVGAFRQRIEAEGLRYRLLEKGNAARVKWLKLAYGDQGILMRTSFFRQAGGFPEVDLMEDLLLMRQVRRAAPVRLLEGPLYVSPRRWQENGVIRQTLRNWSLLAACRLGVPANRLARFYPSHKNHAD